MKITGKLPAEIEVTLDDVVVALANEMLYLVKAHSAYNPQLLHTEIIEEKDGSMWVKEHRFNGIQYYPVPEKEQELIKAIKNLKDVYDKYISR